MLVHVEERTDLVRPEPAISEEEIERAVTELEDEGEETEGEEVEQNEEGSGDDPSGGDEGAGG